MPLAALRQSVSQLQAQLILCPHHASERGAQGANLKISKNLLTSCAAEAELIFL